jgi:hypothetical protein
MGMMPVPLPKPLEPMSAFRHISGQAAHPERPARIPQKWVPVLRPEYAQI